MRAIYRFGKTRRLMCVSHLDLQRFMQMALRRTDLPVAYSKGFNPHPRLSFASALAMGWTSEAELMDVRLERPVGKDFALEEMAGALPAVLPLRGVRLVEDGFPALGAMLKAAAYRVEVAGEGAGALAEAIPAFLAQDEVVALRKTKSGERLVNIRPMARSIDCTPVPGGLRLTLCLDLTEKATLKPDLLLQVLAERAGIPLPEAVRIHRTGLLGTDAGGELTDLFTIRP